MTNKQFFFYTFEHLLGFLDDYKIKNSFYVK